MFENLEAALCSMFSILKSKIGISCTREIKITSQQSGDYFE
ncbi:hypothetical protein FDUTEX481_07066 [Tolypothrix sp. PCC 7601]|nr:hypothetical protein FDUTEX481_07066 [Tolypothrix sp. PCC 7601]